jgi:hypothetical protein
MGLKRFPIFAFGPAGAAGGWRDLKAMPIPGENAERITERLRGQIQVVDTSHEENLGGSKGYLVYSLYRPFEFHDH